MFSSAVRDFEVTMLFRSLFASIFAVSVCIHFAEANSKGRKNVCVTAYQGPKFPPTGVSLAGATYSIFNWAQRHSGIGLMAPVLDHPWLPEQIPTSARVFYLGEGEVGGVVFLVETPKNRYVLKSFFSLEAARRDLKRFGLLKEAVKKLAAEGTPTFVIPKVRPTGERYVLHLEYLAGRTLESVEQEDWIPLEIRQRLAAEFERRFDILKHQLRGKSFPLHPRHRFLARTPMLEVELYLKKSNVLVLPNGEFAIIDPY